MGVPKDKEQFTKSVRHSRQQKGFVPRPGFKTEEEREMERMGFEPYTPPPPRDMRLGKAAKDKKSFNNPRHHKRNG